MSYCVDFGQGHVRPFIRDCQLFPKSAKIRSAMIVSDKLQNLRVCSSSELGCYVVPDIFN